MAAPCPHHANAARLRPGRRGIPWTDAGIGFLAEPPDLLRRFATLRVAAGLPDPDGRRMVCDGPFA